MSDVQIVEELEAVEKSKADQIRDTFHPMEKMVREMETEFNEVMKKDQTPEKSKEARALRLRIKKVRTQTENTRKAQKEQYLIAGRAIDGVANILKYATKDMEETLQGVEDYEKIRLEEERQKLAAERSAELAKYGKSDEGLDLGNMAEAAWLLCLSGARTEHEERIRQEKEEAERKAFEEKARADEEERIRKENEELRQRNAQLEAEKEEAQKAPPEEDVSDIMSPQEPEDDWYAQQHESGPTEAQQQEWGQPAPAAPENPTDIEKLLGWATALEKKIPGLTTEAARNRIIDVVNDMRRTAEEIKNG